MGLCMVYKKKVSSYMNFKRLAVDFVTLKITFMKSCFSAKSVIQVHSKNATRRKSGISLRKMIDYNKKCHFITFLTGISLFI